ncbi:MAG: DUF4838 domain-containing protein [Oscillospiraceae bacterium]|nr:DUF4838 domain-containing protein [Oscillospiraceae bacterium]
MSNTLCENGKANYRIVISKNFDQAVRYAAEELAMFLYRATKTAFPASFDDSEKIGKEIVLGTTNREPENFISRSALKNDGFAIKTKENDIFISGKTGRGTLYGVYSFLEKYAGIKFISYDCTYIPNSDKIEIPGEIDDAQIPPFEYRDIYYREIIGNPDFSARRKCNGAHGNLAEKHGGNFVYAGFVHTFDSIVPPGKYFETHPEYFSLVKGERISKQAQLCLTNPDVLEIAKKYAKEILQKNPKVNIISISQNDCYNPCECDNCREIDEAEKSHAGTLLRFVNAVADSVKDDYPDVIIDTLAYQYTRACPKITRPRENVAIRLCTIECCFSHSLSECNKTGALEDFGRKHDIIDDFDEWAKISKRLYVWDYVTDFCHYLLPHPNLHILKDNINFFVGHNVAGLFEQGCGDTINSDFGALRAYVLSKLMWDPSLDLNAQIDEFLFHYYGKAHKIVRSYIDLFAGEVTAKDICVGTFAHPENPAYSGEILDKAEKLAEKAKESVSHENETVRRHVEIFALGMEYTRLWNKKDKNPDSAEVDCFIRKCMDTGMTHIREWSTLNLFENQPERLVLLGKK